jgi:16S rRNA (cytosine1402-N4)-methyltransferase
MNTPAHKPVLTDRVVHWLVTDPRGVYWDATVGAAGHALALAERLTEGGKLFGSDRDPMALTLASAALTGAPVTLVAARFSQLEHVWRTQGAGTLNGILFDLGLGSFQIDDAARGISFDQDGPLDMRMDRQGRPLSHWLNQAQEKEIARVLFEYGEERRARPLARAIAHRRPLSTTGELHEAVSSVTAPPHRAKTLARVFQAFRILVNDELQELQAALSALGAMLAPGGRAVFIAYHSLEDRMVKHYFRDAARDCLCPPRQPVCTCRHTAWLKVLTRRAETPGPEEIEVNRRARSAKLRAAERIC